VAIYGGNQSSIARVAATGKIYPYITLRANKHGVVLERLVNQGEIISQTKNWLTLRICRRYGLWDMRLKKTLRFYTSGKK